VKRVIYYLFSLFGVLTVGAVLLLLMADDNSYLRQREQALEDLVLLQGALRSYQTDYGEYPLSADGIGRTSDLSKLTTPVQYINMIKIDPFGNPYQYMSYPKSSTRFHQLYGDYVLFSYGFDGAQDTYPNRYREYYVREGKDGKGDFLLRHSYKVFVPSIEDAT